MQKIGLAAALLALSACSPAQDGSANGATFAADAGPAYALRSNLTGASLVKVADLPATTQLPVDEDNNCFHFVQPVSAGGKLAARKGWRLLQEEKFHQFQAVLIVRGGEPLTSGRCTYIDANIALFEGGRLIGILYPKGKDGIAIAGMAVVDGHLRVWSTDPIAQGQVDLDGTDLSFDRITGSDRFCNGRLRVPTVYGLNYSQARRSLLAAGWIAKPSTEEASEYDNVLNVRRRFPEADSCAGTGYAECGFTLTASDGVSQLSIITIGEQDDPTVSDYSIACKGKD